MRIHNPSDRLLEGRIVAETSATIAGSTSHWYDYAADPHEPSATTDPPTLVLVHGFRGTHHGLLPVVARLPEFRVIAPDLPGFGASGPLPDGHGLDDYAVWLQQLLERVDPLGRAVVVGHSFGSLVVARRVGQLGGRKIVLINPIAEPPTTSFAALGTLVASAYHGLGAMLPARSGDRLLRWPLATRVMSELMVRARSRALRAWVHREHGRHFASFHDPRSLWQAYRASISDGVHAHANSFPPGAVLIAGEQDTIAPPASQRRLAAALPQARLHLIRGVGHLIHYETPVAAARILRQELLGSAPS